MISIDYSATSGRKEYRAFEQEEGDRENSIFVYRPKVVD